MVEVGLVLVWVWWVLWSGCSGVTACVVSIEEVSCVANDIVGDSDVSPGSACETGEEVLEGDVSKSVSWKERRGVHGKYELSGLRDFLLVSCGELVHGAVLE